MWKITFLFVFFWICEPKSTLVSIEESSIRVDEIIISIPNNVKLYDKYFKLFNNVRVINSDNKGQVVQRIEGFKSTKNEIVVQMDDDIILEKKSHDLLIQINKFLKSDLKEDIKQLQNICVHQYKRECTTSGCYAEYEYICGYCRKFM